MTYLAVPACGHDVDSMAKQVQAAKQRGAEMVELRLDYLDRLDPDSVGRLVRLSHGLDLPVIVTCRDISEGGHRNYPPELRLRVLCKALQEGADYVDCEWANFQRPEVCKSLSEAIRDRPASRLILSAHDFEKPFTDPADLIHEIRQANPQAVPKLAFMANHINDCFAAIDLLSARRTDMILLCMGSAGVISRILAQKFGSFVTYVGLEEDSITAPGQLTLEQMLCLYRFHAIRPDTEIYGVIGDPVAHSLSPAIFNAAFEAAGVNAVYVPVLVQEQRRGFTEFLDHVVQREIDGGFGFRGFSVTIPHKAHAMEYVQDKGDYLEPLAGKIGAVNTLKVGYGGIVTGYNTDYAGAMDALTTAMGIERHGLHGKNVAVIGAGGVSRAVIAGLADVGAKVTIYNRTLAKAEALAGQFDTRYAPLDQLINLKADIIINCTSIGMHPDVETSSVPQQVLTDSMTVFDTVYNPLETTFLKQAASVGARVVNGAEMFIRQAIAQYRLWFQALPPEDIVRRTVYSNLSNPTL
ncbi:MAG: shikimate dehydrogenase [Sedimentisphaerales bacterium]|nr:shikimate dehydrogenase [Sedimentisphaerales bacterium]